MNTKYTKGSNEGGIFNLTTDNSYRAFTATSGKNFKTLKGAERFMASKGYSKSL